MPRPDRLTPRNDWVLVLQKAGWVSEPVWTGSEGLVPPPRIRSLDSPSRSKCAIPTMISRPPGRGQGRSCFCRICCALRDFLRKPKSCTQPPTEWVFPPTMSAVLYNGNDAVYTEMKHLCHLRCSGTIISKDIILVFRINGVFASVIELSKA